MLDRIVYLLQTAIEEKNWELVKEALQIIQDIEDGYYDNDKFQDIDSSDDEDDW